MVGVWWLVFSIPTFLWVKDKAPLERIPGSFRKTVAVSLQQLRDTLSQVKKMKDVKRFLVAYLIYNDGIQTLLVMSSIIAARLLHMSTSQLALCFLLIQFVAFFGAPLFGWLADKWSHKKAVLVTLGVYLAVTIWASFMQNQWEFWVMGVIVGIILGGSQSATRSLYSNMIPAGKTGEFFSFYAMVGKAAAVLGPLTFGVVIQNFGLRPGIASLTIFYVIGGAILMTVNEKRGFQQAAGGER